MADITLISGSTLGSAEYVAEHLEEKLQDAGFSTEMLHGPALDEVPPMKSGRARITRITCCPFMKP